MLKSLGGRSCRGKSCRGKNYEVDIVSSIETELLELFVFVYKGIG